MTVGELVRFNPILANGEEGLMQVGTVKFSHRNCAQIVPTVSVLPILSVLSLDRISNLTDVSPMDPMSSTPTLGSNKSEYYSTLDPDKA